MPQPGETVTEGTITRWNKKVGDSIAEDEVLFEVSTDKVDSEVPSPVSGVVTEILVQEGETVEVGTRLAVVSDGDAVPAPPPVPTAEAAPTSLAPTVAPTAAPAAPAAPSAPAAPAAPVRPAEVTPAAPPPGPIGPSVAFEAAVAVPAARNGSSRVLSPVVRRLIAEHGLDPNA